MTVRGIVTSKRARIAAALAYAALLVAFVPRTMPAGKPLLLIALGLPLMFRLVPRNWLYGMRSLRTMRGSEDTWYIQNVITGVALVLGGLTWLIVLAVR